MKAEKPGILQEFFGSMGDLGTLLPHLLAVITVAGLSSAAVFMAFVSGIIIDQAKRCNWIKIN